MNKIEYLNALKEALKNIDINVLEEIVADYEEHFQVGLENGKTEEQICEELGSIEDLAREIKEAYGIGVNPDQTGEENRRQEGPAEEKQDQWYFKLDGGSISRTLHRVLDSTGEMINQVLQTTSEAIERVNVKDLEDKVKSTFEHAADRLNEYAETGFSKFSGAFDGYPPQGEYHHDSIIKSYDIPVDQKVNIVVDGICADISVKESTDGKINIRYENTGNERQRQRYAFYSFMEGNTLYTGLRIVGNPVFVFNMRPSIIAIYLEVPGSLGAVDIKTASGEVGIINIKPERLFTETASGGISFRRVEVGELKVRSASGDIEAEDAYGTVIKAETLSGSIDARNMAAKELSLKSASGDVHAENMRADSIDYSTLSGTLEIERIQAGQCHIKSTSGDIEVGESTMNRVEIHSVSSDIELKEITGETLYVKSTSGDVTLDVNVRKCHADSKSGDIEAVLYGDVFMESTSTSGNIDIRLKNDGLGFVVKSRTVSGDMSVHYGDLRQRNLKSGTYSYGNQGSELVLSTVSGNIHVSD